jgi:iron(III) transport system substrate-binding protein
LQADAFPSLYFLQIASAFACTGKILFAIRALTIPRLSERRADKRRRSVVPIMAHLLLSSPLASVHSYRSRKQEGVTMMIPKIKLSVLLVLLLCAPTAPLLAQSAAPSDAAKREGKVVVYGSLESDTVDAIKQAFQRNTGLELEYWRASATKVLDRALSEYRAGKPLFDIVLTNSAPMQVLKKAGIFAKYDSPAAKEFPAAAIDPILGPRYRNVVIGVMYNTGEIKPADAPKSLQDLLKLEFRGKLVMPDPTQHTTTAQWLASLYKVMGQEPAHKFIDDLAAAKPTMVESFLPAAQRVTSGETPVGVTYIKYVYIFGKKGAPLDYVRLPKMLGDGHYITLSNKAVHPDAAKAFIDFFLSDQSMKLMAQLGEFVNRTGIYPPLPGADKIEFAQMDEFDRAGFAKLKKDYAQLFTR